MSAINHSVPRCHPDSGRAALLMIEFVNEWLAPDGRLHAFMADNMPALHTSATAAKRALLAARTAGVPVFHATLKLSPDYRELGICDFGLRGAIPRAGTWKSNENGWRFHPDFAPAADEFIVEGRTGASAFANSNLEGLMKANGITRLYIAGYATHVCVESTMRAAHDLGYDPIVIVDACAAFTPEQQSYFSEQVAHHFGRLISSDRFCELTMHEQARLAAA